MGGLNHTLNVGSQSLQASRQGVDTAGHNIANAHTEGFSRQRVNLEQVHPSQSKGVIIGNGVFVKNITRAHDKFIERQLNQANQDYGKSNARYEAMKPIEEIYSPALHSSVSDELDAFFGSLQDLANFPEEVTVRSSVRESAQSLVNSFQRNDRLLRGYRNDLDERISGEVLDVNNTIAEIAELNVAIKTLQTPHDPEASDLMDRQDLLIRNLSESIDINYYRSDQGMVVIRGPEETLLVERGLAAQVKVKKNPNNAMMHDIVVENGSVDKEAVISRPGYNGRLIGLVEVRDQTLPELIHSNNRMAFEFANHFNNIHRAGFGLKEYTESTGRDFFNISDSVDIAAQTIGIHDLINEDLNSISVASTPFAPGDNVLVNDLLRLKERPLMDGDATFNDFYANYVGVFGLELVRSDQNKMANQALVDDLKERKEAISGVSMDEEAMNLMKWQANFAASSRVITTIDEMMETVLSMKR